MRPPSQKCVATPLEITSYTYAVNMQYVREPEEGTGGSLPQLWGRVDGAPKPSARTEKLLVFVF